MEERATTNAIERLHEEFKRRIKTQTVLPSPKPLQCCSGPCLPPARINMRKVAAGTLASKPIAQPIDLAPDKLCSNSRSLRYGIPPHPDGT